MNLAIPLLERLEPCVQAPLFLPLYDRWITPGGAVAAEFLRTADGFLVRFPGQADFEINATTLTVRCTPALGAGANLADNLFHNAILPLIGNHTGTLNLHASAVLVDGTAIGFLGQSRSGKTTLAGAFARHGHPYLTEDVLELEQSGPGWFVVPKQTALRLFGDSASYLLGTRQQEPDAVGKQPIEADDRLPFHDHPAQLRALFLLGQRRILLSRYRTLFRPKLSPGWCSRPSCSMWKTSTGCVRILAASAISPKRYPAISLTTLEAMGTCRR